MAQALVLVGEPPRVGAQFQEFRARSVRVDVVRDGLAHVASCLAPAAHVVLLIDRRELRLGFTLQNPSRGIR